MINQGFPYLYVPILNQFVWKLPLNSGVRTHCSYKGVNPSYTHWSDSIRYPFCNFFACNSNCMKLPFSCCLILVCQISTIFVHATTTQLLCTKFYNNHPFKEYIKFLWNWKFYWKSVKLSQCICWYIPVNTTQITSIALTWKVCSQV